MNDFDPIKAALFRREALEAQKERFAGQVLMMYPPATWAMSALIALLFGLMVAFVLFGSYTKKILVSGQLSPVSGLVRVFSPQAARVVEKHVSEGQLVEENQILYVVSSDNRSNAMGDAQRAIVNEIRVREASVSAELDRIGASGKEDLEALVEQKTNLKEQIGLLDDQLRDQRARVAVSESAVARYRQLLDSDSTSLDMVHQRESEQLEQTSRLIELKRSRKKAVQELHAAEHDIRNASSKQENRLAQLLRAKSELLQERAAAEAKSKAVIYAPRRGIATAVLADVGQSVDPGRPMLAVVPESGELEVDLYAPTQAIGFIRQGDHVSVRFHAFPYQKFGHYPGSVKSISLAPMSVSDLAAISGTTPGVDPAKQSEPYYRIVVALESQVVHAFGRDVALKSGMTLDASIQQESRRIYEWMLEPLYSLRGNLS
ncbi:membrane fusion protein [Pararobbsia alpina]|uniref:HlyD family secretion protein n=1 Tax=Pararobbsia alpina TaxID=621374 RepID=UPI0039A5BEF4